MNIASNCRRDRVAAGLVGVVGVVGTSDDSFSADVQQLQALKESVEA